VTRAVVVRYRTRPDAADDNERLNTAVFEELAAVSTLDRYHCWP
jgi:hypothetical protein